MKKLLILLFTLYHFPVQAVVIDTVVCLDHVNRKAIVHHHVTAPDWILDLTIDESNEVMCNRLRAAKRLNKKGN